LSYIEASLEVKLSDFFIEYRISKIYCRSLNIRHSAFNVQSSGAKVGIAAITFGNHCHLDGPVNTEALIVPPKAASVVRGIKLGHLVGYFRVVFQGEESVGEALRDV
jgi:hypothetical protein